MNRKFNEILLVEKGIVHLKNPSQPEIFFISEEDLDRVLNYCCWHVTSNKRVRGFLKGTKDGHIFLHQFLLGFVEGKVIDHIDRNPLNNIRSNLRHISQRDNCINRGVVDKSKRNYIGVSFNKSKNRYQAIVKFKGKSKHVGCFEQEHLAAFAYDRFIYENLQDSKDTNFSLGKYDKDLLNKLNIYSISDMPKLKFKVLEDRKNKYWGVTFQKGKFVAEVVSKGKKVFCKRFSSEYDAALAREDFLINNPTICSRRNNISPSKGGTNN